VIRMSTVAMQHTSATSIESVAAVVVVI